jgi:D-glycero-D-manno-heptose 1,7-bisphosphate phosphatase
MGGCIFLDRDGTIIIDKHYLRDPDQIEFIPGAPDALEALQKSGFKLVIISNQSGVGRGYFSENDVRKMHERLLSMLTEQGIKIDGLYYCPHAPDQQCECRKPLPHMGLKAQADIGFDLARSFMIGDRRDDLLFGRALGIPSVLVRTGKGRQCEAQHKDEASHICDDLGQAARWILQTGNAPCPK